MNTPKNVSRRRLLQIGAAGLAVRGSVSSLIAGGDQAQAPTPKPLPPDPLITPPTPSAEQFVNPAT
ncbi:MAG: hypothetical protein ABIP90_12460, partial [Vicinamibacterales bacterium]